MLLISSLNTRETFFSLSIGQGFDFQNVVDLVRAQRWKSELFVKVYGQELDFLYQRNIVANNGERLIQKKMMLSDIIRLLGHFHEGTNSYLVA